MASINHPPPNPPGPAAEQDVPRKRGWLRNRSITVKLGSVVVGFVVIVLLVVLVFGAAMVAMSGIRAYVRGEGLYTHAQKDAVYYLERYARSGEEQHFLEYRRAIRVPLGDAIARREMEKPEYDYARVKESLLQGGNHADDIPYMVFLFRWAGDLNYFAEAINLWSLADGYIAELSQTAEALRQAVTRQELTPERRKQLLGEIERINTRIAPVEVAFSRALNQGAQWVYDVLMLAVLSITLVLLGCGLIFAWRISRGMRQNIAALETGVAEVARGELTHRIPIFADDELGRLAQAFNGMIEHRQLAGEAMERQREFLTAVLDNLVEGVVACDEQGKLSFFNRATQHFHGLPQEPLPPEAWARHYDLYQADGTTPMTREQVPLFRAFEGERLENLETIIAPRDHPARHVLVSGQPIITNEGKKIGAVVTMHDITERKRAEQDLTEHARDLARSNAELEQFAYVASHDLQEPLRTVSSYTQLLARRYRGQLDEDADVFIEHVSNAVHRMREQIEGLLDYSRVAKSQARLERVDLNDMLASILAGLEAMISDTGAQITCDDLPTLPVYSRELGQVFQNLLVNALKFRGEAPPIIHVGAAAEEDGWRITVADNGIGIAPEHAERVFKLYQRLHEREQYPGSGIGLALCRKIVEHHGGRIWVEPAESGSVFSLTLPAEPEFTESPGAG